MEGVTMAAMRHEYGTPVEDQAATATRSRRSTTPCMAL